MSNPTNIKSILSDRYGIGLLFANPTHIEWAADHALSLGVEPAKVAKDLRKCNRAREKMGAMPLFVRYGHPLFNY